jgi:hypothetical protein
MKHAILAIAATISLIVIVAACAQQPAFQAGGGAVEYKYFSITFTWIGGSQFTEEDRQKAMANPTAFVNGQLTAITKDGWIPAGHSHVAGHVEYMLFKRAGK